MNEEATSPALIVTDVEPSSEALSNFDITLTSPETNNISDLKPEEEESKIELESDDPLAIRLSDLKVHGSRLPGDNGSDPSVVPSWFDSDLFEKGRIIGQTHFSAVLFGHLSGLSMVVYSPSILSTLLATGRSRTLGAIFERYLGTLSHVITWYEGNIWNPDDAAHKSLMTVRRMHSKVAVSMNPKRPDHAPELPERTVYLSQYDMTLTQFGFLGMIILYPKSVGFPDNPDQLKPLIHFWRCIGYLLGIDDRFNILNESDLDGTRALCSRLLELEFKPAINRYPNNQANQMSAAIVEAIKAVIPVLSTRGFTKYLYKMNSLDSSIILDGAASRIGYQGLKIVLRSCLPKPILTPAVNALLRKSIQRAQRKSDLIKQRLINKDDLILEQTCYTDV